MSQNGLISIGLVELHPTNHRISARVELVKNRVVVGKFFS